MLKINNLTYKINHIDIIFENLSFIINTNDKIAIVGQNGIGKSILLELIINKLQPYGGEVINTFKNIAYFPQKFNALNFTTVADVFNLEKQVISLHKIETNTADANDYEILDENWDCIEKIQNKMKFFNLTFDLLQDFNILSGGEKVKLILSSIINENTDLLILDEPTNNMDFESKKVFYNFIQNWQKALIIVSHDRELLNLINKIFELRKVGMKDTKLFIYGGNFEFWKAQKELEIQAIENNYNNNIKIEKVKKQESIRTAERLRQGFAKAGRIASDGTIKSARTLQAMNREKSALKQVVNSKNRVEKCNENIQNLQATREIPQNIYFKFPEIKFKNKNILEVNNLNFSYNNKYLLKNINFNAKSNTRVSIEGKNGSGKTTLLKLIIKQINDCSTSIKLNTNNYVYLDQYCDFLEDNKTILENMQNSNPALNEQICRAILAQFLFRNDYVYKKISTLSGGEKLRISLACILARPEAPELILLDEPTNNLDLNSIEILENILNSHTGALIVISHDKMFKENIKLNKIINLTPTIDFINQS